MLTVLFILHVATSGGVCGSEPLGPGYDIFNLYHAGKLKEARKALRTWVTTQLEGIGTRPITSHVQAEGRLVAGGGAAGVVTNCIILERQHNPGARIPNEVYEAADAVRKATDDGFAAFEATPAELRDKVGTRVQGAKAFSVKAKTELLKLELAELRRDGREDRAREILAEEADFMAANNVKADDLLPAIPAPAKPTVAPAPPPVKLNGRELAIMQLLLAYYQALSAEDAAALDRILLQGPDLKAGKDIVAEIARERAAERDFDSIGPVVFDDESSLVVIEKSPDELQVTARRANKSFRLGEKVFTQRESDVFTIRIVDGQYRLVILRKGAR